MTELTDEQREFLQRFGFDQALFDGWCTAVREGRLSTAGNAVTSPIHAPEPGDIEDLPRVGSDERAALDALGLEAMARGDLGVVILNGGMATRFGGVVKGVVDVLGPGRSFLGLKLGDVRRAQEAAGGRIPVFLMNSFATDEATRAHLAEHEHFGLDPKQITHFTQFVSVRMTPGGEVFHTDDGGISPYGPGHGDFAPAMRASGALRKFLEGGGQHLFVANVDNVGARVSTTILGHHVNSGKDMTVEVAPKWPGDVGGSPYRVDGRLQLIEQIRYPAGFDPEIVDVFNTNTCHFRAAALDRDFDLGWYFVEKKVDGRPAVQIERLIGEMTRFLDSSFLRVKRSGPENRFFPVKTPQDLEDGREEIAALFEGA